MRDRLFGLKNRLLLFVLLVSFGLHLALIDWWVFILTGRLGPLCDWLYRRLKEAHQKI